MNAQDILQLVTILITDYPALSADVQSLVKSVLELIHGNPNITPANFQASVNSLLASGQATDAQVAKDSI